MLYLSIYDRAIEIGERKTVAPLQLTQLFHSSLYRKSSTPIFYSYCTPILHCHIVAKFVWDINCRVWNTVSMMGWLLRLIITVFDVMGCEICMLQRTEIVYKIGLSISGSIFASILKTHIIDTILATFLFRIVFVTVFFSVALLAIRRVFVTMGFHCCWTGHEGCPFFLKDCY